MLDNFISDLYPSVFQYLNVKELNIFRRLSKYLKQFCYFFSLIDWSSEIDWSQLKISLSDNNPTSKQLQEHNIHNWYRILKHQRQESSLLDSPKETWRSRSSNFQIKLLQRMYYPTKILRKIVSRVSTGWELTSLDSPIEFYCTRSVNIKDWNIYDHHHTFLAKIKTSSSLRLKEQYFFILYAIFVKT